MSSKIKTTNNQERAHKAVTRKRVITKTNKMSEETFETHSRENSGNESENHRCQHNPFRKIISN